MITIEEILREWDADSPISKEHLDDESARIPKLHSKYLQILSGVRVGLNKRRQKMERLKLAKKEWMAGRMTKEEIERRGWEYDPFKGASKPMKSEFNEWISADDDVQVLQAEIDSYRLLEDTLLDIMNNINWRHQSIRNAIDWTKFQAGG